MKIIAPRNTYDEPVPGEVPRLNYNVCAATGLAHCPCFYNEPDPVIVCPWRCCACMQNGIFSARRVA